MLKETNSPTPEAYRDSIPTVDQSGKRVWLFPRQPPASARKAKGTVNFYRLRSWLSYFLLVLLFTGPFLRINGNPILMFNVLERKASIFGFMFWPEDFHLFALAMVTGMFMLVVFTAVFGRIWCGWLCPQTILMEMVFRKIEYWLEGDSRQQKALAKAPWSFNKLMRKGLKLTIFFVLSFIISNLLLSYVIGSEAMIKILTDPPLSHLRGLTAMIIFTFLFFALFARFREQACTFVCPYGRIQSVLLSDQSIVISYDWLRGDKRGPLELDENPEQRKVRGLGDCIDCNMCVEVCPTGIDIRNGTQMECINCAACIDSCNSVMEKIGQPLNLIRYASHNNISKGERMRFTPRLAIYSTILTALLTLLVILFINKTPVEANLFRTPGTWYQELPTGEINNIYNLRLINKSNRGMKLTLKLIEPPEGTLLVAGNEINIKPGEHGRSSVIITLPREVANKSPLNLEVLVLNEGEITDRIKTKFIGPNLGKQENL